jgi:hypothetical protein
MYGRAQDNSAPEQGAIPPGAGGNRETGAALVQSNGTGPKQEIGQ